MSITAYFDRKKELFTIQEVVDGKVRVLFKQLPAKSGQRGFQDTEWTVGKSPIPRGVYELHTQSNRLRQIPTGKEIGWGFSIDDTDGGRLDNIIDGPKSGQRRTEIMLHLDNDYPGSAGCPALQKRTPVEYAYSIACMEFIHRLFEKGIRRIPIHILN